jgi:hypothetical protein
LSCFQAQRHEPSQALDQTSHAVPKKATQKLS